MVKGRIGAASLSEVPKAKTPMSQNMTMKTQDQCLDAQAKQGISPPLYMFVCAACISLFAAPRSPGSERAFTPILVNSTTIPANGDLNPYGVAFVPSGFPTGGTIAAGDVLVSNFNNGANLQGLGTTIVKLTPSGPIALPGAAVTFFTSTLPGLSTALGVLKGGFVLVGNVPTTDGTID